MKINLSSFLVNTNTHQKNNKMSQILFSTDFVDYLKTTDKTHFSVDVALNLFQQYVMDYNNCRSNGIYYWIIPKDIRMASNFLEILNTI